MLNLLMWRSFEVIGVQLNCCFPPIWYMQTDGVSQCEVIFHFKSKYKEAKLSQATVQVHLRIILLHSFGTDLGVSRPNFYEQC